MKLLKMLLCCALLGLIGAGCRGNDDDHRPPDGMGSILLRNYAGDDIYVYFDGILASNRADYAQTTPYDLSPGSYRVSLSERRGWRSWSGYVDVLQNRLTILDVSVDPYSSVAFDVVTFFD